MAKSSDDQSIEKTKGIMGKLASMPHKPHVPVKKKAKRKLVAKKKV